MIVFLNGQFIPAAAAMVSIFDRGFLYGDGLFETMRVCGGRPFRWEQHAERLRLGAEFLQLPLPHPVAELRRFISALIERNAQPDAVLRLTLTRGAGTRGYSIQGAPTPTLAMTLHPAPNCPAEVPPPARLITASLRLPADDALATFKSCNKLPQILARTEAEARGADEALLLNTRNEVAEAAAGNVFWLTGTTVHTPPLIAGVLAGVTRAVVRELCPALGLSLRETTLPATELPRSAGVFLTNSANGPKMADELLHLFFGPGEYRALQWLAE